MTIRQAVEGEVFRFIARAAMLFSAGIGLPVAGFLLSRAVGTMDAVSALSAQHSIQLDRIETSMRDRMEYLSMSVADHEALPG